MSGVFKAIGKVFKKVVKVALKIAPYALAAAAVIFTGGAALGILPTFSAAVGGLVGSLGLSASITGALTGAITSAGFGAALGFVTGGKKGLQKGALMGALTGGVLGLASPATFGIHAAASGAGQFTGTSLPAGALSNTTGALSSGPIAELANGPLPSFGGIAPAADGLTAGASGAPFTGADLPAGGVDLGAQTGGPLANLAKNPLPTFTPPATPTVSSAAATAQAGQGVTPLAQSQPLTGNIPALQATTPTGGISPTGTIAGTPTAGALQSTVGGVGGTPSSTLGGLNASSTGTGIIDTFAKNPLLAGELLSALGGQNQYQQEANANVSQVGQIGSNAYGGVYSGKADPFGANRGFVIPQPRYYYDTSTNQVVDRQAQGA